jgi:hypothetical protein
MAKMGEKEEAIRTYQSTSERFVQKNLLTQAIALNKIILRLDPSQTQAKMTLADLHNQWENRNEEKHEQEEVKENKSPEEYFDKPDTVKRLHFSHD